MVKVELRSGDRAGAKKSGSVMEMVIIRILEILVILI